MVQRQQHTILAVQSGERPTQRSEIEGSVELIDRRRHFEVQFYDASGPSCRAQRGSEDDASEPGLKQPRVAKLWKPLPGDQERVLDGVGTV